MEILDVNRSVLVVIDLQSKLVNIVARPKMVLAAAVRLLKLAELFRVPVILTEQYPQGIGPTHPDVRAAFDALSAPARLVTKTSFGCCSEPSFIDALAASRPDVPPGLRQIVIAGVEAHVCVNQTVLELLAGGEQVHLAWDAVSARGEEYRRHALDRMAAAGAVVTNHESVGFEWARDKNDPSFKAFAALLKDGQPG
jgi:nicotinamidase-related amidase